VYMCTNYSDNGAGQNLSKTVVVAPETVREYFPT